MGAIAREWKTMLEIRNVTKVFNRDMNPEDVRVALDNVSLSIAEGEFVTVIGGNGSGKSTLLNIISGAVLPDSGNIYINDIDVTRLREHERAKYIGIVFQDPLSGTAANMSLEENLAIALRRSRRKGLRWGFSKETRELFRERLKTLNLGLEDRLSHKIGFLSGGQRQAVTLLMATLGDPQVLLLDEHTAALDPKTARTVLEITADIVAHNKLTTIMVTHNMRDALRYGDRLLMLDAGRIVFEAAGEAKRKLEISDLLRKFETADVELTDEMLLAR
jgi:putative ABC transport system ATP-binding protein